MSKTISDTGRVMTKAVLGCLVAGLLLAAGCTKANPAATCADGTCSDPAFPFCDVDGSVSGDPGSCIAITCQTGSIGGCQGSSELICNATGTTFEPMACANGCDPSAGCIECAPNQSLCTSDGNFQTCNAAGSASTQVCTAGCDAAQGCAVCHAGGLACTIDGKLQQCDAEGQVASTTDCAIGCSDDGGSHCEFLKPSNGLEVFLDMVLTPVDLQLAGGTLDLQTSKFTPTGGSAASAIAIPSFTMPAASGGSPIVVFVGRKITLGKITIDTVSSATGDPGLTLGGIGPAVAFLATDDVRVDGDVTTASGAISIPGCNGGVGAGGSVNGIFSRSGGGGGGNATDGGAGGNIPTALTGGVRGLAAGTDEIVPLRGGCPGALNGAPSGGSFAGHGGGAIAIFSRTKIDIDAGLFADGLPAGNDPFLFNIGGGGGGGSILLEAPTVTLGISAVVLVRGGAGASDDSGQLTVNNNANPLAGDKCAARDGLCGDGGDGATATIGAANGGDTKKPVSGELVSLDAGGGGGGVGRIRINTTDGTFTRTGTAIVAGHLTSGLAARQ